MSQPRLPAEPVRSFRLSREEQAELAAAATGHDGAVTRPDESGTSPRPARHGAAGGQIGTAVGQDGGFKNNASAHAAATVDLQAASTPAGHGVEPTPERQSPPVLPETSLAHQLLDVYAHEARELLDVLQRALETLKHQPAAHAVSEARRAVRTIKGGARMCGLRPLTDLVEACESLIDLSARDTLPLQVIDLLAAATEEMRLAVQRPSSGPGSDASLAAITARLQAAGLSGDAPGRPPAGMTAHPAPAAPAEQIQAAATAQPRPVAAQPSKATEESLPADDVVSAAAQPRLSPSIASGTQRSQPDSSPATPRNPVSPPEGLPPAAHDTLAAQLLEVFLEEAGEMLDILHTCLETLERGPDEAALVEARRAVHTIKGGARMCGRGLVTELAHACEDVIGRPAPGQYGLQAPAVALLFTAELEMRAALDLPAKGPGSDESVHALTERLRAARPDPAGKTSAVAAPALPLPESPASNDAGPSDHGLGDQASPVPPDAIPTEPHASHAPATPKPKPETKAAARGATPPSPSPSYLFPGQAEEAELAAAFSSPEPAAAFDQPVPSALNTSRLLARPSTTAAVPTNRLAIDLDKVEALVAKVTEIVANRTASHALVETLSNTVNEMSRVVHRLQSIATSLHYQITAQGFDIAPDQTSGALELETYGPVRQLLLQLQEAAADQQALVQGVTDVVARKRALAAVETRLDTDLQGALLNMRLLPLGNLRVRLDQVVRSAAAAAGREVRWMMEGQDVALDKHVCDRLFEPLMHLLRNCVDHGIEPPLERETRGKPRTGLILVRAAVEGNQAILSVSDDGRGIDADRIAAAAVTRGLITADQARALAPRDKLDLVFLPGFSTAREVTELSGRGLGMEIVREACTRMGGTVTVGQRQGGGTVVTMLVPLSMSVVHCLIARESGRLLAIPASQVTSVQLVAPAAISRHKGGGYRVRLGAAYLRLFTLPGSEPKAVTAADEFEERILLLLPYRGERVALLVDEIVEEEDQIVKPLPMLLQGMDRLLGAVMLGDGTPAPVLNLPPILDQAAHQEATPAPAPAPAAGEQVVLVVDDSLTMRLALMHTLEHAGYLVETARDGQEALEYIRANGMPNLVTLDIEMPRMDGLETLYAVRHMPGGETLPIFMLSSRTGKKHVRTAERMGATRYFTKPYHDSQFVAAVRGATGLPARIDAELSGTIVVD